MKEKKGREEDGLHSWGRGSRSIGWRDQRRRDLGLMIERNWSGCTDRTSDVLRDIKQKERMEGKDHHQKMTCKDNKESEGENDSN